MLAGRRGACFEFGDWTTALSDANTLNSGECGLTDGSVEGNWRLPNACEMRSLVDFGHADPALPSGHPFTSVQAVYYWTSTTAVNWAPYAWYVHVYTGMSSRTGKEGFCDWCWVWPVRGG